jgi:hypothetical protein
MTTEHADRNTHRWEFVWNLILGFLVSALSVLTAGSNYMAYQSDKASADLEAAGDRSLAISNTDYLRANQFIILDYSMFDGEYIQRGVDEFAADYYKGNFSTELQSSIDRGEAFDSQYYDEKYAESDAAFDEAFVSYDKANALKEREAGYQLAMLIASVGLAFAAYASLLTRANFLRGLFAFLAFLLLAFGSFQFLASFFV